MAPWAGTIQTCTKWSPFAPMQCARKRSSPNLSRPIIDGDSRCGHQFTLNLHHNCTVTACLLVQQQCTAGKFCCFSGMAPNVRRHLLDGDETATARARSAHAGACFLANSAFARFALDMVFAGSASLRLVPQLWLKYLRQRTFMTSDDLTRPRYSQRCFHIDK